MNKFSPQFLEQRLLVPAMAFIHTSPAPVLGPTRESGSLNLHIKKNEYFQIGDFNTCLKDVTIVTLNEHVGGVMTRFKCRYMVIWLKIDKTSSLVSCGQASDFSTLLMEHICLKVSYVLRCFSAHHACKEWLLIGCLSRCIGVPVKADGEWTYCTSFKPIIIKPH